jgi:hypothetical protein
LEKKKLLLTLAEWIDREGASAVAWELSVTYHCVRLWRVGEVLPRTDLMKRIVKMSKGSVSYSEMIEHFYSPKNKARRPRRVKKAAKR